MEAGGQPELNQLAAGSCWFFLLFGIERKKERALPCPRERENNFLHKATYVRVQHGCYLSYIYPWRILNNNTKL